MMCMNQKSLSILPRIFLAKASPHREVKFATSAYGRTPTPWVHIYIIADMNKWVGYKGVRMWYMQEYAVQVPVQVYSGVFKCE